MKPNSNNLTGFKKTDISNTENHQGLHNSYHSLYKSNINNINGHVIDQPCASNSWINGQLSSSSSSDKLAKYTNIDELTDFKKLCIFNLPESDGYESSTTIQQKRELLLAREFGISKEVRKRDEQADTDIGRESYAAEKKKKTKRKKVQKTSSIRRSSSKPSDESADLPDAKDERECTTPESIEESSINQKEESSVNQKEDLQNGYSCSDSLILKQEEEDDNMDKGNDSDSSSMTNQDMDEMIVVKKKRRNRIKNNTAVHKPAASSHSQTLPENKSAKWDKHKQRNHKINNEAKLKPLKISTASFDLDQDFPPLCSHPLSATIRREKVQSPPKYVDTPQVHPSKSDSDLPTPTQKERQQAFIEENKPSVEVEIVAEHISDNVVEATNEEKEMENQSDIQMKEEVNKCVENVIPLNEKHNLSESEKQPEVIDAAERENNNDERGDNAPQLSDQPGPSSGRHKGRRNVDHRSHSQNNFTSPPQSNLKHRPRIINSNNGTRRPRYSAFQNYSNNFNYANPMMNVPYVSPTPSASGYPLYYPPVSNPGYPHAYAQLPPLYPHPSTGFVPHQTFLPVQLPLPNMERFQGTSFFQQYPMHGNAAPAGIPSSAVNSGSLSTIDSKENIIENENTVEVSPATTPVADYNGHCPPSIPVTVSDVQNSLPSITQNSQSVGAFIQNNCDNHLHQRINPTAHFGHERTFVTSSSIYPATTSISVVDSTMAKMVDANASPLSQSPDSLTSSTTHPPTTTGSSNSDPSLISSPSCPRVIDTLTLSPDLQKTVREAFGLQPNEGIFYIYATNEKGEHTRQMRVILHNTTPVKFGKFASPVYLSPTVGSAGEFSPAGFYYAKQERFNAASSEGHSPIVHTVTQHHPILSFSVTIPEPYQIPLMPTYYPDVIVLPPAVPNQVSTEAPTSNATLPSNSEPELLSELSPSASELSSSIPTTTSNNTSAQ